MCFIACFILRVTLLKLTGLQIAFEVDVFSSCFFSCLLSMLKLFDDLHKGSATLTLKISDSCSTCYNVRLLKVIKNSAVNNDSLSRRQRTPWYTYSIHIQVFT